MLLHGMSMHWAPNSDNSIVVLAGADLLRGKLLLHGWALGADPFWTSEIPLYAGAVALFGATREVAQAVPAATWAVMGAAGVLAVWRSAPRGAAGVGVLVAFALLMAPGPGLLEGAIHVGTTMLCLIGLWLLSEDVRGRPAAGLCGCAVLIAATAGEPLGGVIGGAAAAGGSLIASVVNRAAAPYWRAAAWGIASIAASEVLIQLKTALHGFSAMSVAGHLALSGPAAEQSAAAIGGLAAMLPLSSSAAGWAIAAPRWAVLLLAVIAVGLLLAGGRAGGRQPDTPIARQRRWLVWALAVGALADFAGFAFYAYDPPAAGRRLVPVFVYGAVLIGLLVAELAADRRRWLRVSSAVVAVALLGFTSWGYVPAALSPVPADPHVLLARWLRSHGLVRGYGAYWDASVVTLDSSGQVVVRPVAGMGTRLVPFPFNTKSDWYGPADPGPKTFVVFAVGPDAAGNMGVNASSAQSTFGPPLGAYVVDGRYGVLVFSRDLAPTLH